MNAFRSEVSCCSTITVTMNLQKKRTKTTIMLSCCPLFFTYFGVELVTDTFGLSNDPYTPGGLIISADEMASPPPVKIAGHPLDNKTIVYTHKIDMSGTDDSGAVGNCSAYFRVWR